MTVHLQQNYNALSQRVQKLQDDAVFERILLRGPRFALDSVEVQPTSDDIDTLMRNMMVTPDTSERQRMTRGPWSENSTLNPSQQANQVLDHKFSFASGGTASTMKRSPTKGKGKAREDAMEVDGEETAAAAQEEEEEEDEPEEKKVVSPVGAKKKKPAARSKTEEGLRKRLAAVCLGRLLCRYAC